MNMTVKTIKRRIQFRQNMLDKLEKAYETLVTTGVKQYSFDDRSLTRLDLPAISEEIEKLEDEIDQLESLLAGAKPRKVVGIVPRDW